jgi:repressor LexA
MPRKSAGLGERHRKIMEFLTLFQEDNGYSPSIREIGENIGVNSTSLVDYYLRQLVDKGYIERDQHVSRSIRILKPLEGMGAKTRQVLRQVREAVDVFSIPILGRIVASAPIPLPSSDPSVAYFDPESTVEIARSMLPPREQEDELFALEVQGDSMIDAMVGDGDIVIMKSAQGKETRNGEMVAVWLDNNDETTLKYFYREKNRIRLQPANPVMDAIYVDDPAQVRVLGKVVMVIRQVKSAT